MTEPLYIVSPVFARTKKDGTHITILRNLSPFYCGNTSLDYLEVSDPKVLHGIN